MTKKRIVRISRIVQCIIHFNEEHRECFISAKEISDMLEIPIRTLEKDLKYIVEVFPVETKTGTKGGIRYTGIYVIEDVWIPDEGDIEMLMQYKADANPEYKCRLDRFIAWCVDVQPRIN